MGFFDGIVFVLRRAFCFLFLLKLRVPLLFPWGEEAFLLNEAVNPCCHIRPAQLHIGAACFFQDNAAAVVAFITMGCTGNGVRAPSGAILIFEESCLFLARVLCGKVFVDSALAALHTAAAV